LTRKTRFISPSVSKKPEIVNELRKLHEHFVLAPVDTLCLFAKVTTTCIELGFTSTSGKPSYTKSNLTKDEILQYHLYVLKA
jgi:hypothetical protein